MPTIEETAIEHHKEGDLDKAELLYTRILKHKKNPQISYLLGTICLHKKRYNWAQKHLEEAIAQIPTPPAYCCLAHAYLALKQYEKAIRLYELARSENPDYPEALLGNIHALIKNEGYQAALELITQLNPQDPYTSILIGQAYEGLEKIDDAMHHYHIALQNDPNSSDPHFHLGKLYLKQGKWDWAQQALQSTINKSPDHAEAHLKLGQTYQCRNSLAQAEECYRKAHKLQPDNIDTLIALGSYFEFIQRDSEALAFYERAIALDTEHIEALQKAASILFKQGHLGQAEELYERILDIEIDSPETLADLCKIRHPGPDYYQILENIHRSLSPKTYIEIGIERGQSLAIAKNPSLCIGIDPTPAVVYSFHAPTRIFPTSSDSFFKNQQIDEAFGGLKTDLAFIDGSHQFKQALRDFINIEKHSHSKTIAILHGTLPIKDEIATEDQHTEFWAGDLWKIIPCLIKYRPELKIACSPTFPNGLGYISGLNPESTILNEQFDGIINEYSAIKFSDIENPFESLNVIPNEWIHIQAFLANARA